MPYAYTQGSNAVATMQVQGGPSQVDIQETRAWTQTCGPTTCNKAAGGCPHSPARPRTTGPTACKEAAGGCPHREAQTTGPTACNEAAGGCPHREAQTTGPTTCNEAAGGCPHREARYNRTNNLQRSRAWLPTRTQDIRAEWLPTRSNIQLVSSGAGNSQRTCSAIYKQTYIQCNHSSSGYLRGLPPGHTAASNIWIAHL